MKAIRIISFLWTGLSFIACSMQDNAGYYRGVGVYPGNPEEYDGPVMVADKSNYRNIALKRAAYHSSSYDYNLTAQLITDGVVESELPYYLEVFTNEGEVAKRDRERIFDDNTTAIRLKASKDAYLMVVFHNRQVSADRISFTGSVTCDIENPSGYSVVIEGSENGTDWTELEKYEGKGLPGNPGNDRHQGPVGGGSQNVSVSAGLRNTPKPSKNMSPEMRAWLYNMSKTRGFEYSASIPSDAHYSCYRIRFDSACAESLDFQELNFIKDDREISVLPSYQFHSAWMSAEPSDQWVYVDFGAKASFDNVKLYWIEKPVSGRIETSDDGESWKSLEQLPQSSDPVDDIKVKGSGRYLRLAGLNAAEGGRIILSELEVYGKGGLVPEAQGQMAAQNGNLSLRRGNWKLERSSSVPSAGNEISKVGFDDCDWTVATVPGTVAGSYFNAGAIPDIRYDGDQFQISESFFYSDFWYRNEFEVSGKTAGEYVLNFDGINWKSEVYMNRTYLGRIDGAFTRAHFNVTGLVKEGRNAVAVKIIKNDHIGIIKEQTRLSTDTNGGVLGADNPTMHATVGWDWIPTVRGRNTGIWNDVYLTSYEGSVSVDDVFVSTDLPLPSCDYADITPTVTLTNNSSAEKAVDVDFTFGEELSFSGSVTLAAGETRDFVMPAQRLQNPQLWWPNGYGEQYLYDVKATANVGGVISDVRTAKSGVREMSYTMDDGILDIYVNGRRLIGNGGNWGYPEINLNYRAREYDIAVRYHADMNFTMIRNWVGMTGDDEFYEACDRYGVMVWQDFWLANPVDGPNPYDDKMFLDNAADFVRRIRNHPSIALYVGRNEGDPPASLNGNLDNIVRELHPGLYYIPNSASGPVSGGGPYRALPVEEYFSAERGRDRLHSERGMPNVMTYESMARMLRKSEHWPQTAMWGVHDYTLENAQSAATFNEMVSNAFGDAKDMKQFTQWAQWINYAGYRAMFESRSPYRKGILLWMSHSCWPSMVWQTYDYYFEPTAAYFGAKKGSAPIRIQWNPVTGNVEVVNNNASDRAGLTAYAEIVNCDGTKVFENSVALDSAEDTTTPVFALSFDDPNLTDVYFIRLRLTQGEELLADNFYWEGKEAGNYKQLLQLPEIKLKADAQMVMEDGEWKAVVTLENDTQTPALMIRLNVKGARSGESILPVFYEDNYFSLLPGESKTVTVTFSDADTSGEKPSVSAEGFNVGYSVI